MNWYAMNKKQRLLLTLWYLWNVVILQRRCKDRENCSKYYRGEYHYCDFCLKVNRFEYPQGWDYYAGDVCEHGRYTGGCGIDWICGACEDGIHERTINSTLKYLAMQVWVYSHPLQSTCRLGNWYSDRLHKKRIKQHQLKQERIK